MRDFFYRLSWDKDFRWKFWKWFSISACSLSCIVAISIVVVSNLTNKYEEPIVFEEEEKGELFSLEFEEHKDDDQDNNNNQNPTQNNNNHDINYTPSSGGGGSQGGGGGYSHTHHWYRVVDSEPWDEAYWVQVGTNYICTACGYITSNSESASSHSGQTGHKFRTEALWEQRTIHHAGTSHEECECGARR